MKNTVFLPYLSHLINTVKEMRDECMMNVTVKEMRYIIFNDVCNAYKIL